MLKTALIGGTFDTMHAGHREYIKLAFDLAESVHILLSSDTYANILKPYFVKNFSSRKQTILDFVKKLGQINCCIIHKINSLEESKNYYLKLDISLAIVIPEYRDFVENINIERERRGLKPFLILIKPRTKDHDGSELSSTKLNGKTTISVMSSDVSSSLTTPQMSKLIVSENAALVTVP